MPFRTQMVIANSIRYGIFSLLGAGLIALLAIGIDEAIESLDSMLIPCQHGTTWTNGKCSCIGTPFVGKYCGICNCSTGYCTTNPTTPRITSDYGCKCPQDSKFFGFLCDQCHAVNKTVTNQNKTIECKGMCDDGFFGTKCDRKCFANLSHADTLDIGTTGDEMTCKELRANGGTCNACSGHGTCKDGYCECYDNWYDTGLKRCSSTCPVASNGKICSGKGICKLYGNIPSCLCESGWRGTDCSIACPGVEVTGNVCNGHGSCSLDYDTDPIEASCDCNGKFRGEACDTECPGEGEACSGHGTCTVDDGTATCICETGMLAWNGPGCNCTDLLSCNGRGSCVNGNCECEGNFDGTNCLKCKPNFWGSRCQWYCDPDADHDDDSDKVGCHGHGTCTVFNMDTVSESIGCTCNRDEVKRKILGKFTSFYSSYSPDLNCKDCYGGYFPKVDVFNAFDTTPLKLYVPCQVQCVESTCNEAGVCNDLYGKPGEPLCSCDISNGKHISEVSYCTKCDNNWFPSRIREDRGCTKFCIDDLTSIGGSLPDDCDSNECVHCNGAGTCNPEGACECEEGYTGEMCQIQCTSPDGVICGGHGKCESSELQLLLQHEMAFVEDSGPSYTCTCDPQDTYTKEARAQYISEGGEGTLDPPPDPTYFGETCDFHCERPPWSGSDECNGLGNCTIFEIADPNDNVFDCQSDDDCKRTDVTRIISGDSDWTDRKGPFCQKSEYPDGCGNDMFHIDNCIDIMTLQRPPQVRAKKCVENTLCRQTIDDYDWHEWCSAYSEVSSPALFETCGAISQFCPAQTIDSKCSEYVTLVGDSSISSHMDYCYENDKKRYPFKQTNEYRLSDNSARLRDFTDSQMARYHSQHPEVNIDIAPYCAEHMKKFDTVVSAIHQNKRFFCGSILISDSAECFSTAEEANWKPFSVNCPNEEKQFYATYLEAEANRATNCIVKEDEPRKIMSNAGSIPYGSECYADSDCMDGKCNGNTCCTDFDFTNCLSCNNIGECAACKTNTTWDGLRCAGTPVEPVYDNVAVDSEVQKEGLDMIDNTCSNIVSKFPTCNEPQNPCEIDACKAGDTCTVSGNDAICETDGVLDCSCGYGLECVPLTFTTYKCVGNFESSTCPSQTFNWAGYCKDNNPVLKHYKFGSDFLTKYSPPVGFVTSLVDPTTCFVCNEISYVSYWVQPTTIFSTSKYVELTSKNETVARVYLHQGQIQLNRIQTLESCPLDSPTCQDDWGYEPGTWYNLELFFDYANKQVTLTNLMTGNTITDAFLCTECPFMVDELTINGETTTYYDEILVEKKMPLPPIYSACNSYPYCDMDVNYRSICSDIIRNVDYPLLLEPKHDIVDTCSNFFEYQSFDMYPLTIIQRDAIVDLDWDNYCLFFDSIVGDYDCGSNASYTYFEAYDSCRDLVTPLDGSTQCMQDALSYDWTMYCSDLELAAVPTLLKMNCPESCYKHLKDYDQCEDRLAMYSSNTDVIGSSCPSDWYPFCRDVSLDKHKGVCSGIECKCDHAKYEGVSGSSCELHCDIASDGTACGEGTGVGKCVYTDEQKEQLDNGSYDADGNWIAFDNVFELNGQCDCFLSEGKKNCDQECMNCNNDAYNEIVVSPADPSQWGNQMNLHLSNDNTVVLQAGTSVTLDMREDDIVTGVIANDLLKFNVSVSQDSVYFEPLTCDGCESLGGEGEFKVHGFGRYVRFGVMATSNVRGIGVKITRSGQVGICNGGTGVCDCLPPFTAIVEEKYTNWRGVHRKRLNRVFSLPPTYNADEEYRIRAMQGKESFTKNILRRADDSRNWETVYREFRNNPSDFKCAPDRNCSHHDFILLGNLDKSSFRFNFDCNTECQATDPVTKIPCSGHGSCRVTGDCMCDPAAYVRGVNEVTGFSMIFNLGDGDTIEQNKYEVSKYDKTGWRGPGCEKMCPGYDPVTNSMLNVCSGRGVCNDEAKCECDIGFIGEVCQFTCPGFELNEENVCSGHGTCTVNLIEIVSDDNTTIDVAPIDCGGTWSAWSACDGDRQTRTFNVTEVPLYGGVLCPLSPEYRSCHLENIDCDGTWSDWGACDSGFEQRNFTATQQPVRFGLSCPLTPQKRICSIEKIDCEGTWGSWSACDGTQERTFTVTTHPENNGLACPDTQQIECSAEQVNCEYVNHGWSDCINGTQYNTYTISMEAASNGVPCPENKTRACNKCPNTGYCCIGSYPLCAACNYNGYCTKCIGNATTQINGKCECDHGYIYQNGVCTETWNVVKDPIYKTFGGWSDWSTCLIPGVQSRVRSKDVSLAISIDGPNDFRIDGVLDPHLRIEKQMVDENHYNVPYIDVYTAKVSFTRINADYPARLVSEAECPSCHTGQWTTEPISSLPDIVFGGGTVEWTPTSHGIYYLISPQHPSMVAKFTVEESVFEAYETQNCTLVDEFNYCSVSRECVSAYCVPEAIGDLKRCSSDPLCKSIDENGCTSCQESASGTPCVCPGGNSSIEDDRLECHSSRRRLLAIDECSYPYCDACNSDGKCSRCKKDAQWIDGACRPVDCSKHYGKPHLKYVEGRGCLHSLGSTSCTSDDQCGVGTNGKCLGGVCCNELYNDTSNCMTCNDGLSVVDYQPVIGLGGLVVNTSIPMPFSEAVAACDASQICTGIFHANDDSKWYLGDDLIELAGYTTYRKVQVSDQYCSQCLEGSEYIRGRDRCIGMPCPVGQQWTDGKGCTSKSGEADNKMQAPVRAALNDALCSPGLYKDIVSNECRPVRDHPMVNVTLYIDKDTPDQIEMTMACEVWGVNVVKCAQCNCFFDYIYGKWSSFECETCLKGYGQKQCRTQCPNYDLENDISMCGEFGVCSMGSFVNANQERVFQDASCTCGNPPGRLNDVGTEMKVLSSFYTELTTITEEKSSVMCHNEATMEKELVDTCYHFDDTIADCSKCGDGFSGENCKYRCEKCLMGGRCDNRPSEKKNSACECPDLFGIPAGLWSYNCCPVGWRVTDMTSFNAFKQESEDQNEFTIDSIALNTKYNPLRYQDGFYVDSTDTLQDWTITTAEECENYQTQSTSPLFINALEDWGWQANIGCTKLQVPDVSLPISIVWHGGTVSDQNSQANCNGFKTSIDSRINDRGYTCVKKRIGLPFEDAKKNADFWCKPCPGVDSSVDGSWLSTQAQYEVCGGVTRGSCYRKNDTHNGCQCIEGNGGNSTDLANDWVGMACRCNAAYPSPYKSLLLDYGCNGLGQCLGDVVNINGVDIACYPNAGHYTKLEPVYDEQNSPTGSFQSVITAAAHGTHVPYDGNLYVTDMSAPGDGINSDCIFGYNLIGIYCHRCNYGYHQLFQGQSSCDACPIGEVTKAYGKAYLCHSCGVGRYATRTISSSVRLDTVTDEAAVICLRCPGGRYQDETTTNVCKKCPNGKYNPTIGDDEGDTGGWFVDSGYLDSDGVEKDRVWVTKPTTIQSVAETGSCTDCPDGTYLTSEWTSNGVDTNTLQDQVTDCMSCPAGKQGTGLGKTTEANGCEACPIGMFSTARSASCSACELGSSSNDGVTCSVCPAGKGTVSEGSVCTDCPAGTFGNELGFCTSCPYGKYQSQTGQTVCTDCVNEGTNVEGATSEEQCGACSGASYGSWGDCSVSCDSGTKTRSVSYTDGNGYRGLPGCPDTTEDESCSLRACEIYVCGVGGCTTSNHWCPFLYENDDQYAWPGDSHETCSDGAVNGECGIECCYLCEF